MRTGNSIRETYHARKTHVSHRYALPDIFRTPAVSSAPKTVGKHFRDLRSKISCSFTSRSPPHEPPHPVSHPSTTQPATCDPQHPAKTGLLVHGVNAPGKSK